MYLLYRLFCGTDYRAAIEISRSLVDLILKTIAVEAVHVSEDFLLL
jgi:hypothetical protein